MSIRAFIVAPYTKEEIFENQENKEPSSQLEHRQFLRPAK